MKMSWELIDPGTNGWSTLHPYRNDHDPCTPQSPVVHLHSPLAAMCAAVGRAPTPFELPVARTSGPGDVLAQNWKLAPRGWKPMRWTKILFQGYFMIFWCFLFPAQKRVLEDKSRTPYVFHGQHSLIWKNIRILLQNQQLVEERLRKEKKTAEWSSMKSFHMQVQKLPSSICNFSDSSLISWEVLGSTMETMASPTQTVAEDENSYFITMYVKTKLNWTNMSYIVITVITSFKRFFTPSLFFAKLSTHFSRLPSHSKSCKGSQP